MKTRPGIGDLAGAFADLGVFVPLAAALVVVNGLDPGPVLVAAGLLAVGAGVGFRVPFPVQPLKALAALAIAQRLSPAVIHAAGLEIGLCLLVLAVTGLADRISVLFTKPVIRSLQLGVGTLLVISAFKLAADPPGVFTHVPSRSWTLALTAATAIVVAVAARLRWHVIGVAILATGVAVAWVVAAPSLGRIAWELPHYRGPAFSVFGTAFVVLVIPQLPLTFGNAVVGVSDLAREHFGHVARRVTPGRVALSAGVGNVASALMGGMPMCHGSSGFSAHVRLGARTPRMNLMLGGSFLALGLGFSGQVLALFGTLPVWVLAGFLAYAGLRHAGLVLDLRGGSLLLAVGAAVVGILTGNLAWTTGIVITAEQGERLLARARGRRPGEQARRRA